MTHATQDRAAYLRELAIALKDHDKAIGLSLLDDDGYVEEAEWADKLGMTPEQVRNA